MAPITSIVANVVATAPTSPGATLMLAAGISAKVDVYSHVVPGMQAEAAERIADIVMGKPEDEPGREM